MGNVKKIQIKSKFNGSVLFEYECDDNTIKITTEEAVRVGVCLDGARLNWVSLDGASLNGASMINACLDGSSMNFASLDGASMMGASLEGAYMYGASLEGASLDGAYLNGAYLNAASLDGASLRNTSLNWASLNWASLSRASMSSTSFVGAYLDDKEDTIEEIKQFGYFGSTGRYTVAYKCKKSIKIRCGCFFGTLAEFESKVAETHGDNKYGKEYRAVIDLIRAIWE